MKKEEIEQLKKQLNDISDKIKQLEKPQFEVGWYNTILGSLYFINRVNDGRCFGYGFDGGEKWIDECSPCATHQIDRPATDKEVEAALVAEAKRRGFKEGVNWESIIDEGNVVSQRSHGYTGTTEFIYSSNELMFGYGCIFSNGKWAEIVKEEKIMIGETK
jgi:hypothetical protein